jgi:hypothetical protein
VSSTLFSSYHEGTTQKTTVRESNEQAHKKLATIRERRKNGKLRNGNDRSRTNLDEPCPLKVLRKPPRAFVLREGTFRAIMLEFQT